jgi:hypothetical protein
MQTGQDRGIASGTSYMYISYSIISIRYHNKCYHELIIFVIVYIDALAFLVLVLFSVTIRVFFPLPIASLLFLVVVFLLVEEVILTERVIFELASTLVLEVALSC